MRALLEVIQFELVEMELKGDLGAIREVLDRTEDKPRQAIDMDVQLKDWRDVAR